MFQFNLPTFHIHFLDGYLSEPYSGIYLLISQYLPANSNISGTRNPCTCGTSMKFTLFHATYYTSHWALYKFVSSEKVTDKIWINLFNWRKVHSSCNCQYFVDFSFCRSFESHFSDIESTHFLIFFHKYIISFLPLLFI